jgi:16S rRNA (cytosine967-C5)-methyltransferase
MNQDPRLLAVNILSTWLEIHDPPRIESRESPQWQALLPRDRALAFDLVCGVIRRRLTLDAMIHSVSRTALDKIEPDVMAVLRLGVYQLVVAQGIADHAAINTSVNLVRQLGAVRAASFVNAVLRNIQRLGGVVEPLQAPAASAFPLDSQRQVRFNRAIFPDPQKQYIDHIAVTTSHPRELVAAMIHWIGPAKLRAVLIADNVPPVVTLRCDQAGFVPPNDAGLVPHHAPNFFVAAGGWNPAIEELIAGGTLSPQDPTAGRAVQALTAAIQAEKRENRNLKILDLCAGLGTKSIQLARAFPKSQITSCDIAADKPTAIQRRALETGVNNIHIMDVRTLHEQSHQRYDVILVDAPCSNTGVMGRRLQVRWRWPLFELEGVRKLQLRLLGDAAGLLHRDGLLVYSTCSIDPAENSKAAIAFIQAWPQEHWRAITQAYTLPTGGEPAQRCDGGFLTVFKRQRDC